MYLIEKVFPIRSMKYFIVHVKEKNWSLRGERIVTLVCENRSFLMKYVGFGNMNSQLALKLVPIEDESNSIDQIFDYFDNQYRAMYLTLNN